MKNGHAGADQHRIKAARLPVFVCAAGARAHARGACPPDREPRLGAAFLVAVVLLVAAANAVAASPGSGPAR
jgi:hypothetical protein